jgi:hypothetical protein
MVTGTNSKGYFRGYVKYSYFFTFSIWVRASAGSCLSQRNKMYATFARDDSKNDRTSKGSRTVDEVWQTKAVRITGRIQRFAGIELRDQEHLRN